MEVCVRKGRKHCGKRRKCWFPAFSYFPTMLLKAFSCKGIKGRFCVVNGLVRLPTKLLTKIKGLEVLKSEFEEK